MVVLSLYQLEVPCRKEIELQFHEQCSVVYFVHKVMQHLQTSGVVALGSNTQRIYTSLSHIVPPHTPLACTLHSHAFPITHIHTCIHHSHPHTTCSSHQKLLTRGSLVFQSFLHIHQSVLPPCLTSSSSPSHTQRKGCYVQHPRGPWIRRVTLHN